MGLDLHEQSQTYEWYVREAPKLHAYNQEHNVLSASDLRRMLVVDIYNIRPTNISRTNERDNNLFCANAQAEMVRSGKRNGATVTLQASVQNSRQIVNENKLV